MGMVNDTNEAINEITEQIDKLNKNGIVSYKLYLLSILTILCEASRSMAIIADKMTDGEKSEESEELEKLTYDEQSIFLKAMEREEKVCKETDEYYRSSGEDNVVLVKICHEITRKVKKSLWENQSTNRQ